MSWMLLFSTDRCITCHSCGPGAQADASADQCEKCRPGNQRYCHSHCYCGYDDDLFLQLQNGAGKGGTYVLYINIC